MPAAPSPEPAALLRLEAGRLREAAALGPVVDVACGRGRNALPLAREGAFVIGLDRSREHLAGLAATAQAERLRLAPVHADLEAPAALPLADASAGAVLTFRYLHRPLAEALERVLVSGGLLLYETFTVHHREVAEHPRNPAFLLEPGELPTLFPGLTPLHYEEVRLGPPAPAAVARLVARKP